ncbi:DUF4145 domain-containing protein [Bacillus sp. RAR_GA_16]|uniref:DUF4145 domain-containing protein n=1 Tax=Bacillus sp. RAR_GA_16 TaxID=2876774 RepID=UPI001CCE541B|nr:DUF4145 domain-containing protein [Bacillus sp. RAR_GA_16]MCA0173080.1 DUF4145 domain-containing protein [Bacillus sp. RAR_GA_16]
MEKIIQPSLNKEAFNCPRCGVLCKHKHYEVKLLTETRSNDKFIDLNEYGTEQKKSIGKERRVIGGITQPEKQGRKPWDLFITLCAHCYEYTIWENKNIIFPYESTIPDPSSDMPDLVISIYTEAQLVFQHSPRASAALLRLAIETLIPELDYGINKDSLNNMIAKLVQEDIPVHVQKGLDGLRYYGNNGIHTAEIDMQDDRDTVIFLFKLCNMIVEELITKRSQINDFYDVLPDRFRQSVEKRDTAKNK